VGKKVISVSTSAQFINEQNDKEFKLQNLALSAQLNNTYLYQELLQFVKSGHHINNTALYEYAKHSWENGILDVKSITYQGESSLIQEAYDLFSHFTSLDTPVITYLYISNPNMFEWALRVGTASQNQNELTTEINYLPKNHIPTDPDTPQTKTITRIYNDNPDETFDPQYYGYKAEIGNGTYLIDNIVEQNDWIEYHIGSEIYYDIKPTTNNIIYYVESQMIEIVSENVYKTIEETLIINYDQNLYPYMSIYEPQVTNLDFTGFPILDLFDGTNFKNKFVFNDWNEVSDYSIGHSVIPSHKRNDFIQNLSEQEKKEFAIYEALFNKIGIGSTDFIDNVISSSKNASNDLRYESELVQKIDAYNQTNNTQFTKDEIVAQLKEELAIYNKTWGWFNDEPNFNIPNGADPYLYTLQELERTHNDQAYEEYFKYNRSQKDNFEKYRDSINSFNAYLSDSYNRVTKYIINNSFSDKKQSLDDLDSYFISMSLNLQSQHNVVLKAIFYSFEAIYSLYSNTTNVHIRYEENHYNKTVSFKSISKIQTDNIEPTLDQYRYDKYEYSIDNQYEITQYKSYKDNNGDIKLRKTTYRVVDLQVSTYITKSGKGKTAIIEYDEDGSHIPLFWQIYNNLPAQDKALLGRYAVTLEIFSAHITHLKWYETPEFLGFLQIAITIVSIVAAIPSGGTSLSWGQITSEIIKQGLKYYIVNRVLDLIISEIGSDEIRAVLRAIQIYVNYSMLDFDTNIKKASFLLDSTSKQYLKENQIHINKLKMQFEKNKKEIEKLQKEIEDKSGFTPLDLEMISIEEPEDIDDFYERTTDPFYFDPF